MARNVGDGCFKGSASQVGRSSFIGSAVIGHIISSHNDSGVQIVGAMPLGKVGLSQVWLLKHLIVLQMIFRLPSEHELLILDTPCRMAGRNI
jgi:hypothetical protein